MIGDVDAKFPATKKLLIAPRTSIHGISSSPQTTIDSLDAARPSWSVLKYKNDTSLVSHSLIKKTGPVTRRGSTRTETKLQLSSSFHATKIESVLHWCYCRPSHRHRAR
jgi:hypothetical protein